MTNENIEDTAEYKRVIKQWGEDIKQWSEDMNDLSKRYDKVFGADNVKLDVGIKLGSTSYPYLSIAKHWRIDYGRVLEFVDKIESGVAIPIYIWQYYCTLEYDQEQARQVNVKQEVEGTQWNEFDKLIWNQAIEAAAAKCSDLREYCAILKLKR